MTDSITERLQALTDEKDLDPAVVRLMWAAFTGQADLDTAIADAAAEFAPPTTSTGGGDVPVWLNSIAVEGFRGIGPRAELVVDPGPGLTLVVGRNGSGKSSFAEGLEALLTGDNQRWRGRPTAWQDGWRNLHHHETVEVTAEFARAGTDQPCTVTRTWGDDFDTSTTAVELSGMNVDLEWLQWDDALATYKPFLSYNELGSMLEQKDGAIYDSIAGVLGLEQITEARDRLGKARLDAQKPGKALKAAKTGLVATLEATDDARAAEALELLKKRTPDLDALEALGVVEGGEDGGVLRQLASISAPDVEVCAAASIALRDAAERHDAVSATDAGAAAATAELLATAIAHFDTHGDGPCPVCAAGSLDAAWATDASNRADQLRQQSTDIADAASVLTTARRQAMVAISPVPDALTASETRGVDVAEARDAWAAWQDIEAGSISASDLADRLDAAADVATAVEAVRAEAKTRLEAINDVWRPAAGAIAAWVRDARVAREADAQAKQLGAAEDFFKDAEAAVREERFAPIAAHASELWAGLRQQSNVSLEGVTLEGKRNNRRVNLDVTVDGTETSALGVMSQGELHALALSLFLPRVTSVASPFRFVLIDDPVQAMDPARVDGLAKVLAGVARERQVIVFTHDDRLPAACRRLALDATVFEVDRRANSKVSTRWTDRPSRNALDDASTIARSRELPDELQRRIVPVHCRRAVEAAAREEIWHKLLSEGQTHDEVEQRISDAQMAKELLAILLGCHAGAVQDRLDDLGHNLGRKFGFLNVANHSSGDVNVGLLVSDAKKLVDAIHGLRR